MWKYQGQERPDFADEPGPEQESVWDYPRPPRLEVVESLVEVFRDREHLASSPLNWRVLETASPPTYYIPMAYLDKGKLFLTEQSSHCEWKGEARYWGLTSDPESDPVAWSYPDPLPAYRKLKGTICFYPGRTVCSINGEPVEPQPGGFYGGWVTSRIAGPFKGLPGTENW